MQFNINAIRSQIDVVLKLLCAGNSTVLQRHKFHLRPTLPSQYHHLLKPTNLVTNELLGDDIDQKILESNKLQEVSCKLHVNHCRGRGSHRFPHQGNNFKHNNQRHPQRGYYGQNRSGFNASYRGRFSNNNTNPSTPVPFANSNSQNSFQHLGQAPKRGGHGNCQGKYPYRN